MVPLPRDRDRAPGNLGRSRSKETTGGDVFNKPNATAGNLPDNREGEETSSSLNLSTNDGDKDDEDEEDEVVVG